MEKSLCLSLFECFFVDIVIHYKTLTDINLSFPDPDKTPVFVDGNRLLIAFIDVQKSVLPAAKDSTQSNTLLETPFPRIAGVK